MKEKLIDFYYLLIVLIILLFWFVLGFFIGRLFSAPLVNHKATCIDYENDIFVVEYENGKVIIQEQIPK